MMPLDELPANNVSSKKLRESLDRTHRWQLRSLAYHKEHQKPDKQQGIANRNEVLRLNIVVALYGIIHGGIDSAMRIESSNFVANNDFDGIAIGGSLGSNRAEVTHNRFEWHLTML